MSNFNEAQSSAAVDAAEQFEYPEEAWTPAQAKQFLMGKILPEGKQFTLQVGEVSRSKPNDKGMWSYVIPVSVVSSDAPQPEGGWPNQFIRVRNYSAPKEDWMARFESDDRELAAQIITACGASVAKGGKLFDLLQAVKGCQFMATSRHDQMYEKGPDGKKDKSKPSGQPFQKFVGIQAVKI